MIKKNIFTLNFNNNNQFISPAFSFSNNNNNNSILENIILSMI